MYVSYLRILSLINIQSNGGDLTVVYRGSEPRILRSLKMLLVGLIIPHIPRTPINGKSIRGILCGFLKELQHLVNED